jgi:glutamyl-tRNA reductase
VLPASGIQQQAPGGATFEFADGLYGANPRLRGFGKPAAGLSAPLAAGALLAGSVAVLAALATPALVNTKAAQDGMASDQGVPAGQATPLFVGLSHKTATVEVREKLSIPEAKWNEASAALCEYESIAEAAVLSTCNRFEVYIAATDHAAAARDVMEYLGSYSGLKDDTLRPNLVSLSAEDASWHMLRVAAGLDSMVVGECQILSQIKACYKHATAPASEEEAIAGSAGKVLGRMLNSAVTAGKFVRSETAISKGAVSISSAAVELAMANKVITQVGKPLKEMRIAIVGAGTMARLLLAHLASHGVTNVTLLSRTRGRCEKLAEEYPDLDIDIKLMDEFWSSMEQTDLAFTSTSATKYIVTKADLEAREWGARETPMAMIDISVPRNVETACNEVAGVYAYNVDDLKQVLEENKKRRQKAILEAEDLLRDEQAKFLEWQKSLPYTTVMKSLQKKFEAVREEEIARHKANLQNLSDKEREAVNAVIKGMNKKLLHGPMSYLRSSDANGTKATVDEIEQVFHIGNHTGEPSRMSWLQRLGPDGEAPLTHTALHDIPSWAKFEEGNDIVHPSPTMVSLRDKFEAVRNDEVAKASKKGLKTLSDEDHAAVQAVTRDIVNDLLDGPMTYVKAAEGAGDGQTLRQIEALFLLGKKK